MSINYVAIGERIRKIRCGRGLTQADLAELSGIEPSNISHIERAATKLSLQTFVAIANALGATLDEIGYGNVKNDVDISSKAVNEVIEDCTPEEIRALVKILAASKMAMRELNQ